MQLLQAVVPILNRICMSTLVPTLYSYRRCPYAMRARMALKYAGIKVVVREVILKHKPADMLKASPKGTVPVLMLDQEHVIDESLDIMQWALAQSDPDRWCEQADAANSNELIACNDGPFKALLDQYKYADRYPQQPATHYRREAVTLLLQHLEKRLEHTPWLCGTELSMTDIAIFPFVRQFARVDMPWFENSGLCALGRWLERLNNSALFLSIMPKLAPWQEGKPDILL